MSKGGLSVVATPIGNLDDIGRRALATLAAVDCVLCEDTRVTARLLARHGIATPLLALHAHNERRLGAQLVRRMAAGEHFALVSDAGAPAVSDPGRLLVARAHEAGLRVEAIPGPSAVTAALSVAGEDADRFVFDGFLPARAAERKARLRSLANETRTLVCFEAPHRILDAAGDLCEIFGAARRVCLVKELSKVNERVVRGSAEELRAWLAHDARRRKGEFVLVIAGREDAPPADAARADELIAALAGRLPPRAVAEVVASLTGERRNAIYRKAQAARKDD